MKYYYKLDVLKFYSKFKIKTIKNRIQRLDVCFCFNVFYTAQIKNIKNVFNLKTNMTSKILYCLLMS